MNLPVIISKVGPVVKNIGGKVLLLSRKHAPEVCIGLGVAGFCGTVAATVHATNETRDILDKREEFVAMCGECLERKNPNYTAATYERDMKFIRKKTRRELIKAWWPVGTLGAGSVISVLGGYKILNGRYVATAAAYKTLEAGYERYRENVIAKFGEEADKEMMEIREEEIAKELKRQEDEERAEEESGKKKKKKTLPQGSSLILFDERSDRWRRYWQPDQVIDYLLRKECECNDQREIRGHIFENEVRDILGVDRTQEGQVLGWINKPVDFGLSGKNEMEVKRIRNILSVTRNGDIHVPIRLETEGIIFDKI